MEAKYPEVVTIRLTSEQLKKLRRAAGLQGRRLSGFIRYGALLLAEPVLAAGKPDLRDTAVSE